MPNKMGLGPTRHFRGTQQDRQKFTVNKRKEAMVSPKKNVGGHHPAEGVDMGGNFLWRVDLKHSLLHF